MQRKQFRKRDFMVMALGNMIGSGVFLVSGAVIKEAGSWAPAAYLAGGFIAWLEVMFLIELALVNPVPGSFKACAQDIFGPAWGFVNGWIFYISALLAMAGEVLACSLYLHFWFPQIPLAISSLAIAVLITWINHFDAKGLSYGELGLSILKLLFLVLFVAIGCWLVVQSGYGTRLVAAETTGPGHFLASLLLVLYAYTGTGIIGLAATETDQAEKVVPKAGQQVILGVTVLYTLAVSWLVWLVPIAEVTADVSPFLTLLGKYQITYVTHVINLLLFSAALSSLNSQVYSASRMLLSMAQKKQAPQWLTQENAAGTPVRAVQMSGVVLVLIALAALVIPNEIFLYTIGASSVLALINWISVCATHYLYRKKYLIQAKKPKLFPYLAPFYPYASWLCLTCVLFALGGAFLWPEQIPSLIGAFCITLLSGLAYFMVQS